MRGFLLFLLMFCASGVSAQAFGVGAGPDLFAYNAKKRQERRRAPPLALALDLALGTSVWAEVQLSSAGPVLEVTGLVREGFYKREIIELILLSAKARRPLKQTVEKRRKGDKLSKIALDYGEDFDQLEGAALAVEELVDREYLPRLRERQFKKGIGDAPP